MAPFLPPMRRDETLRGYLTRVAAIGSGSVVTTNAMTELFGRRLVHASMPNGILAISQAIDGACGSPEVVLHDHTLFDYYYALSSENLARGRADEMLGCQPGPRVPTRYPLVFSIADGVSPRCPLCSETAVDGVCLCTELRIHLMPFQQYCPIHGEALVYRDCSEPTIITNAFRRARLSQRIWQQNFDVKSMDWAQSAHGARRAIIERQLLETHYTSESGRTRRTELVADLQKFFSEGFADNRLTSLVRSSTMICTFLNNCHRLAKVPSTAIGILLEWYLSQCEPLRAFTARHESCHGQICARIPFEDMHTPNGTKNLVPEERNIPSRKLLDSAISVGGPVRGRPQKLTMDLEEFAVAQLCSGISRADVARSCVVSIGTINRLYLRRGLHEPATQQAFTRRRSLARAAWLRAFANSPDRSRTELRHALGADWSWLSRHDNEWLRSVETQCISRARAARLCGQCRTPSQARALAAAIRTSAKSELEGVARPQRLTKAELARSSGLSPFVLNATPACVEMTEIDKTWVRRRLTWARRTLHASNLDTDHENWRLWRTARIRPRNE
jgi:hypothetical protein